MNSHRLLVIAGPTASGKSALALGVAEKRSGEIVNCDSMQMVRGLDIGTAKPTPAERQRVPHHLYDSIAIDERYSAGRYMEQGRAICREIAERGRLPIVVGGTGLYLKALLHGVFEGPGRSRRVRERLNRLAERIGNEKLHRLLEKRDPVAAGRIDAHDRRRTVRALEVHTLTGRPVSELQKTAQAIENMTVVKVGIDLERSRLYDRINRRVEVMFAEGLLDEVRALLGRGHDPDAKGFEALGYRQAVAHLQQKVSIEEAIARTQLETRRYAKRQLTWFRREPDLVWLPGPGESPQLLEEVVRRLDAHGI